MCILVRVGKDLLYIFNDTLVTLSIAHHNEAVACF